MSKKCRHSWSDESTGIYTGQIDRRCLKCGHIQHTQGRNDRTWVDGPPLSVEEFRKRGDELALRLRKKRK